MGEKKSMPDGFLPVALRSCVSGNEILQYIMLLLILWEPYGGGGGVQNGTLHLQETDERVGQSCKGWELKNASSESLQNTAGARWGKRQGDDESV